MKARRSRASRLARSDPDWIYVRSARRRARRRGRGSAPVVLCLIALIAVIALAWLAVRSDGSDATGRAPPESCASYVETKRCSSAESQSSAGWRRSACGGGSRGARTHARYVEVKR
jgi:hypothetical protein